MSEIKVTAYRVNIIESEIGWGQKIDEVKYFDKELEAKKFVEDFNSANDKIHVPDWYTYAEFVGKV